MSKTNVKLPEAKFLPAGDRALLVEYGRKIDEATNDCVAQLANWLEKEQIEGIVELVPTYCSLMICYEPKAITYSALVQKLKKFKPTLEGSIDAPKKIWEIPCLYDGEDLADMEELCKLSKEEIIKLHSSVDYRIYMLGFLPGFVYLGGLDGKIHAPRLQSPRTAIPAGSVAIGGGQTGIYPIASPGGWRLIGRTPLKLYDPDRLEPILCKAGEYIRFVPISEERFQEIEEQLATGAYTPHCVEIGGAE